MNEYKTLRFEYSADGVSHFNIQASLAGNTEETVEFMSYFVLACFGLMPQIGYTIQDQQIKRLEDELNRRMGDEE